MICPGCGSAALRKTGLKSGAQRYNCKACGRYCTDRAPRFSVETKALAVRMYLNSMGIRAIGRVLNASPAAVLTWIRKEHALVQQRMARQPPPVPSDGPDIIEMDEIYTYVQKNDSGPSSGRPTAVGRAGSSPITSATMASTAPSPPIVWPARPLARSGQSSPMPIPATLWPSDAMRSKNPIRKPRRKPT